MNLVTSGALFALSVAVLAAPAHAGAQQPGVAPGAPLPPLSGDFLTGKRAVLPGAAKGKVALLALGFTYDSRFAVEAWTAEFRKAFGADQGVTFFEVPMLGGAARLGRWFIDSGMRKGTPRELHENVITVYGGTGDWKKWLKVAKGNEDAAFLILLDPDGRVQWLHAGPFERPAFEALQAAVSRVLRQSGGLPADGGEGWLD